MKTKLLRTLSVIGLILAAIASLDLTSVTALLPRDHAGTVLAAGLIIASLKDFIFVIGDLADDGKRNNSWVPLLAWLLVPLCLLGGLCSCSVKLGADGSKEATLDGQGFGAAVAGAAKVIAQK